ncbi:MAG: Abi family protein [Saccharofermentanales bacterium]|jgi:abortive infection bacteriophage resistance protein
MLREHQRSQEQWLIAGRMLSMATRLLIATHFQERARNTIIMLKPIIFRTYEKQIEFMRNRGIRVSDEREATEALSTFSYYSLVNLNKHLYGGLDVRTFLGNPSILDLQLCHMINMSFFQIVLKGILYVETSFKTKLSYLVSSQYGVTSKDDIYDPNNNFLFRGHYDTEDSRTNGILKSLLNKQQYLQSDEQEHAYAHHFLLRNRQLPPWIFIHDVEFGLTIQWYNILREEDKNSVCAKMIWGETNDPPSNVSRKTAKRFLDDALQILREYRNTIAHGERVFPSEMRYAFSEEPLFAILRNGELTRDEYDVGIGLNDPYACLLAITTFIHDPILMFNFLTELQQQLDFGERIKHAIDPDGDNLDLLRIIGIPSFTMERLKNISHDKFGDVSRYYFTLLEESARPFAGEDFDKNLD